VRSNPRRIADGSFERGGEGGRELILLNPLFDETEQMERLAFEVIPQLC
jgi:hypothetical protein